MADRADIGMTNGSFTEAEEFSDFIEALANIVSELQSDEVVPDGK